MTEVRERRWRALVEVEFVTVDYAGAPEEETARRTACYAVRGARRAEKDVNVPRPTQTRLAGVEPLPSFPLDVWCGECSARAGDRCRNRTTGSLMETFHPSRCEALHRVLPGG